MRLHPSSPHQHRVATEHFNGIHPAYRIGTRIQGQRIRAEKLTYRLDSERIVAEPQSGRQVTSRLKLRPLNSQTPAPLVP